MIDEWLEGYVRAWRSDDPADVRALFTVDAEYYPHPFRDPWRGREAIVREWIDRGDSRIEWDWDHRVIAVDGDTAVVDARIRYPGAGEPDKGGTEYASIWVVRFAEDGRAREFREWWVPRPARPAEQAAQE